MVDKSGSFGKVATDDNSRVTGWQWEESADGNNWQDVGTILTDTTGANTDDLFVNAAPLSANGTQVRCRADYGTSSAYSDSALLTVVEESTADPAFVLEITVPAGGDTFTLDTVAVYADYYYTLDWGDGTIVPDIADETPQTHNYAEGVYQLRIEGQFSGMQTTTDPTMITDVISWGATGITRAFEMFANCTELGKTGISAPPDGIWTEVRIIEGMFKGCSGMTSVDLSFFNTMDNYDNTQGLANFANGASACTGFGDLSNWSIAPDSLQWAFYNCNALQYLDLSGMDMSRVVSMANSFDGCNALATLGCSTWSLDNCTTLYRAFRYCDALVTLDVSNWGCAKVTTTNTMFFSADDIDVDISAWTPTALANAAAMFSTTQFSDANFNKMLEAWAALPYPALVEGTDFGPGNAVASGAGQTAKDYIIDTYLWTFT